MSTKKTGLQVRFKKHARDRIDERMLDYSVIEALAEGAAPMLAVGKALRFRVGKNVVVATKRDPNIIEVITAWAR